MINGTNLLRKDNPRSPIGNPLETMAVKNAGPAGPRHGPPGLRTGPAGARQWIAEVARKIFDGWPGAAADRLAGLPRRAGARVFAATDKDARWRGWQITELRGGMARRYRDPRFDALRAPVRYPDPEGNGRSPGAGR